MTKSANIEGIETATHISWNEWLGFFDSIDAKNLSHKEIAEKAYEKLEAKQASRGWWAQSVAVAYEQHIGRRQPGQRADGTYEVAVNKVFMGTMDEALRAWVHLVQDKTDFSGVPITGQPTTSKTEKWRHWRMGLDDGSRISADAYQKAPDKTGFTVTHTKLENAKIAEQWRSFWKEFLKSL